jgi:tetratricopeptide (TPR) repeat protein
MTIGPYVVMESLGGGGFGCVYVARERGDESRRVAIKVPRCRLSPEDGGFLVEARTAAALEHPGIVPVLDVGETCDNPPLPDGTPYIVMPFMEGGSLAAWVSAKRPPAWRAAAIVAEVARAVDFAHRKDIIHRDLKPENVLLDGAGRPWIADFGIAVNVNVLRSGREAIAGTLAYMSPEQLRGERIDLRTDIWSLGVILYALLTRTLPFPPEDPYSPARVYRGDRPEPPRLFSGTIPRGLADVCMTCLRERDDGRYERASDLADALDAFARPEALIVNAYNLMKDVTEDLVGRERELEGFLAWAESGSEPFLIVTDCGGTGKSAAAWAWFETVRKRPGLPFWGYIWFSFERLGATFTAFVREAVRYTTGEDAARMDEDPLVLARATRTLLAALKSSPYVVVLDGFELLLNGYASYQPERPASEVPAPAPGEPDRFALRAAREFFKDLATPPCRSRLLITSRIFPADLRAPGGDVPRGCQLVKGFPFDPQDALRLWRKEGCSGDDDDLLTIFEKFACHPLWIQIFAKRVKGSLNPRGDFEAWCAVHPQSELTQGSDLWQSDHRGLEFALDGLGPGRLKTLQVLSRMRRLDVPKALDDLFVRHDGPSDGWKAFASHGELVHGIEELVSRGLLVQDEATGGLAMHPIIRDAVFRRVGPTDRDEIRTALRDYYDRRIQARDAVLATQAGDLAGGRDALADLIDLCWLLAELGQHREAFELFERRIDFELYYRVCDGRDRRELIAKFAPLTPGGKRLLDDRIDHIKVLFMMAKAEMYEGRLHRAIEFFEAADAQIGEAEAFRESAGPVRTWNLEPGRVQLKIRRAADMRPIISSEASHAYRLAGRLRHALRVAEEARRLIWRDWWRKPVTTLILDAYGRSRTGLVLSALGRTDEARRMFQGQIFLRSWRLVDALANGPAGRVIPSQANLVGFLCANISRQEAWLGHGQEALRWAREARRLFNKKERRIINLMHGERLVGAARLLLGRWESSRRILNRSLEKARLVDRVEEILLVQVELADLHRRCERFEEARGAIARICADDSCEYRTARADAFNVLARIEKDVKNPNDARKAADRARQLALCDDREFHYTWGVERAREVLEGLPEAGDVR